MRLTQNIARSRIIKVKVGAGQSQRTHQLQEALLKDHSGFFRGCLSNNFAESDTQEVNLPMDQCPIMVFDCFVNWLYTDRMVAVPGDPTNNEILMSLYVKAYILGDRLLSPGFQNRATKDLMQLCHDEHVYIQGIFDLAQNGLENSKMARFLIKQLAFYYGRYRDQLYADDQQFDAFLTYDAAITKQFLRDLLQVTLIFGAANFPRQQDEPARGPLEPWLVEELEPLTY